MREKTKVVQGRSYATVEHEEKIYVSEDGVEFGNKIRCEMYEKGLEIFRNKMIPYKVTNYDAKYSSADIWIFATEDTKQSIGVAISLMFPYSRLDLESLMEGWNFLCVEMDDYGDYFSVSNLKSYKEKVDLFCDLLFDITGEKYDVIIRKREQ